MAANDTLEKLSRAFFELEGEQAALLTNLAIEQNINPVEIMNTLTGALREIGNMFEEGEIFLPELVTAGEIMKNVMPLIEVEIKKKGGKTESLGIVVIGTVYGDLHDIGKTMVTVLLKVSGFSVYDLGVNVPPEKFVTAVKEYDAQILAMSALLTTTMIEQKRVIELLTERGLREKVKVMIGGAAVSKDYAKEIGADGYSPTAPGGVKLARTFLGC
jgi:corrinoid protein of di/trimethylamine methyltransferase